MNKGFGIVTAFLSGALTASSMFAPDIFSRPALAMLVIALIMAMGWVWQKRALCARWLGRKVLGYADSVSARGEAEEQWRIMIAGDKGVRDIERQIRGTVTEVD